MSPVALPRLLAGRCPVAGLRRALQKSISWGLLLADEGSTKRLCETGAE